MKDESHMLRLVALLGNKIVKRPLQLLKAFLLMIETDEELKFNNVIFSQPSNELSPIEVTEDMKVTLVISPQL